MIDPEDEINPATDDVLVLAELTEEVSRRLESGESVNGGDLGDNAGSSGAIRQLLPTLRTMVALGDQVAREEGSRTRSQKKKEKMSSFLDTNSEVEEVDP